mgnify:CR=1 FL=1
MSKKSRRRNKRLLALAGLAGAVALSSKRKRDASIADNEANESGFAASNKKPNIADVSGPIKDTSKSDVVAAPKKVNNNTFRTRQRITDSAGNTVASAGTAIAGNKSKVTNVTRPGENMYSSAGESNPRRVNRKSGGRVKGCGIAKRGLGRAIKKGKR